MDFIKTLLMHGLGRGIERGVIPHQRAVQFAALRYFGYANRLTRIGQIAFGHKRKQFSISRLSVSFDQHLCTLTQIVALLAFQSARQCIERTQQRTVFSFDLSDGFKLRNHRLNDNLGLHRAGGHAALQPGLMLLEPAWNLLDTLEPGLGLLMVGNTGSACSVKRR